MANNSQRIWPYKWNIFSKWCFLQWKNVRPWKKNFFSAFKFLCQTVLLKYCWPELYYMYLQIRIFSFIEFCFIFSLFCGCWLQDKYEGLNLNLPPKRKEKTEKKKSEVVQKLNEEKRIERGRKKNYNDNCVFLLVKISWCLFKTMFGNMQLLG